MSSINQVVRYNQCALEKLVPFKPLKLPATQCPYHPQRANCRLVRQNNAIDNDSDASAGHHVTILTGATSINYDNKPYYCSLLQESAEQYGFNQNANLLYAYVNLNMLDEDEEFYGIDAAGEKSVGIIRMVLKHLIESFDQCKHLYILTIDEPCIDLMYSMFRAIILPQRVVCLYQEENVPLNYLFNVTNVPVSESALNSQLIYRSFLTYNTILTMILKQSNPFNDARKSISIILRNLGKCPANKSRIKCCDLAFGGNSPGHIMCPPREMVKRIFHYAKWSRTPNNYRRYYQLITQQLREIRSFNNAHIRKQNQSYDLLILDWHNFIEDFFGYFGV
ncbi:VP1054 [Adoxophyes orana nucleopolyhedrovirus]|uniref:VP1054 n=1 Tax=Adoxophyes orana nucleopolyhedrovirus TaxID=542343 RepID=UPI0001829BF7|nr:VP1054 [Adoxophyes orana nucleopolyhedrovirus]ACF05331.1 VP1054 [Adoxophyes orana nucleopolyhedrovirus]